MSRRFQLVLAIAAAGWLTASAEAEFRPERIGWSEAHFQARKIAFSIDAELRLKRVDDHQMRALLVDPKPGGWRTVPAEGGWRLDLFTRGLGRRSKLALLIDREGRSLQRTQVEVGRRLKDHRNRTHRFGDGIVHVRTLKPERGEQDAEPDSWSQIDVWTPDLPDGIRPGQSTGLFYTLAAGELNRPGDRVTTWLLAKSEVSRVELVVEGRELIKVDFVEVTEGGERRRTDSIPALRISVSGERLEDDRADSDFRFMGLHGDIDVLLDPATRAPLLLTGKVSWLGRAQVKLKRLVLADR